MFRFTKNNGIAEGGSKRKVKTESKKEMIHISKGIYQPALSLRSFE